MRHPVPAPDRAGAPRQAVLRGAMAACLALGAALVVVGACTEDPFERPGTWQATGVNDANLRAMAADPAHLQRGVGAGTDRGQAGSAPIIALQEGRRPQVPTTELTGIGAASGGGATGAR